MWHECSTPPKSQAQEPEVTGTDPLASRVLPTQLSSRCQEVQRERPRDARSQCGTRTERKGGSASFNVGEGSSGKQGLLQAWARGVLVGACPQGTLSAADSLESTCLGYLGHVAHLASCECPPHR